MKEDLALTSKPQHDKVRGKGGQKVNIKLIKLILFG